MESQHRGTTLSITQTLQQAVYSNTSWPLSEPARIKQMSQTGCSLSLPGSELPETRAIDGYIRLMVRWQGWQVLKVCTADHLRKNTVQLSLIVTTPQRLHRVTEVRPIIRYPCWRGHYLCLCTVGNDWTPRDGRYPSVLAGDWDSCDQRVLRTLVDILTNLWRSKYELWHNALWLKLHDPRGPLGSNWHLQQLGDRL